MLAFLILLPMIAWGLQDVFVKVSANTEDNFYLKIPVCYGVILTLLHAVTSSYSESGLDIFSLIANNKLLVITYILFFLVAYISNYGAKFLEMSIFSPVANLDGAMTVIMLVIYFFVTGKTGNLNRFLSFANIFGIILSIAGVFLLSLLQSKYEKDEKKNLSNTGKKKKYGAWALVFPLFYCLFDGATTFVDTISLNADCEESIGPFDYLRILCFEAIIAGIISYVILFVKSKKVYNPFTKSSLPFYGIATCEVLALVTYPFAVEKSITLPIIAYNSYSIVTIIVSRIFLKEKLSKSQYLGILIIMIAIIILSIAELGWQ